jgi:hypothetical protein
MRYPTSRRWRSSSSSSEQRRGRDYPKTATWRCARHLTQPLWRLVKGGHVAEALVRPIDGIGVELRYEWNGDLRVSQMFKSWEELEAAASEKRRELEARGWHSEL